MRLFRHRIATTTATGGFAVVDVETTGLYPSKDRVVEVAVVHLDGDATIGDAFSTLVNPQRDVGKTRIHGISASDVVDAPTFAQVASLLWEQLTGRVFVSHNVQFDLRMLDAEFRRLGVNLPPPPAMCTMRLAANYIHGLPARSLSACCDAAGVELAQHHSALHDATASAQLLACFRAAHRELPTSWQQELQAAGIAVWKPKPAAIPCKMLTRETQLHRRAHARAPLADLVHSLPRGRVTALEPYFAVVDRALEDRLIDETELATLTTLAGEHGVTPEGALSCSPRIPASPR